MIGTALVQGLGSMLSGGASAGMSGGMGMGRSAGMSGLFGMASGMGRGGMGRSSGMSGLFNMMPTGMGSGMSSMFGQGRGRGMGMAQDASGSAAVSAPAMPAFALKSAVPGRRRYYAAALQGNEELAKLLEKNLGRIAFIDSVKASSVTGSLLVCYTGDEGAVDRLMADLGKRVFGATEHAGFNLPQGLSDLLPAAGVTQPLAELGASIRRTAGAANVWLHEKTHGWLDFPSVFALGFIVRGLRKILLYEQRPSGPQMLWWAFSILKGWKMI
ncbi:HMA2 domain-containing protein [Selenomonas sputigena]|nr:hypothetical protein [Selenomonas sputigena]